jgi:SAM-dependent methyltransferase
MTRPAPHRLEITPEVLLKAYAVGIFPMAESADDPGLHWIEPQRRGIIPLDGLHVSHRLARTVRSDPFEIRIDSDFDVILFLDVLEHLDDPGQALRHAVSLLENGGIILATVPAFMWLWTAHDDLNHHRTRYDRRSLRSVMESAGLRVERTRYLFQWLVGAKLLVRGIEAVRRPEPSSPSIPPAPINGMLTGVSAVEEWLGRFLPPPFGGSLLMVARPVESSAATTGE